MNKINQWLKEKPKYISLPLLLFLYLSSYLLTNQLPIFKPQRLFFMPKENNIPFIDWSIAIYFSIFIQILIAALILNKEKYSKGVIMASLIIFLHLPIFILFPTCLPRTALNMPAASILKLAYRTMHTIDPPNNCFPSLHISISFLTTYILWQQSKKLGIIFFIWSLAIAISTLTTKQHYIIDIIGGLCIFALVSIITDFKLKTRV